MAAEPPPTTVVGVIFYVLPWMGLTPHALSGLRLSDPGVAALVGQSVTQRN
jgi:hypothetical protein